MTASEKLVFTSELALKRSIRKVYPELTDEQQEATFNEMKNCVGCYKDDDGNWIINGKKNDKTGWSGEYGQ